MLAKTIAFIISFLLTTLALSQVTVTTSYEGNTAYFYCQIDSGWHIYSPNNIAGPFPAQSSVGELQFIGQEIQKYDDMFSDTVRYFENKVTFFVECTQERQGTFEYMCCNDTECRAPQAVEFVVPEPQDSTILLIIITAFIAGLLTLLTPCVWPIIPMTVSFFLKRNTQKQKAIAEAIIYGVSIILIFLIVGIIFSATFGANSANEIATNAVINILFTIILIAFGLSFCGLFEINLPSSWSTSLSKKSSVITGFPSIFLMALTLVIVSFSCTAPIVGMLLVQVSTGSLLEPIIGMFFFALAIAIPFTLFAIFPSFLAKLPRSGDWMTVLKFSLGIFEIAFALKFLSIADLAYGWHILPYQLFMAIWTILAVILLIYFLRKKLWILALIPTLIAIYFAQGITGKPLKEISAFTPPVEVHNALYDVDLAVKKAKAENKHVLLNFTGYGCVNCRKMEATVFANPQVKAILDEHFIVVNLYVDDRTELPEDEAFKTVGEKNSAYQQQMYGVNAQPYYVIYQTNKTYTYNEDVEAFIKFLTEF